MLKLELKNLPKIADKRGNLTFIENEKDFPFRIHQTGLIYDMPVDGAYGEYACKHNEDFVVALSGSVNVILDNGREKRSYCLNRPHFGLYIPRMHWRKIEGFCSGTVVMILSADIFDENDYIREYNHFNSLAGDGA